MNGQQEFRNLHAFNMLEQEVRIHSGRGAKYKRRAASIRNYKKVLKQHRELDNAGRTSIYVLVDYRDNNAILKKKEMGWAEVSEKNRVLSGTGMAWARLQ